MSQMSDYLENKLVDHLFRTGTFAKPTVIAVGLFTASPADAGGGTEVTGGSYARAQQNPSDTNWTATQGGTSGVSSGSTGNTTNATVINFPTPSAGWGLVTHFGIYDAASGGNLIMFGSLGTPKTINTGDAVSYPVGTLQATFA